MAQALLGRDITNEGHQRLERAARIYKGRGVAVPQLVRNRIVETHGFRATVELATLRAGRDPPSLVGEEELNECVAAGLAVGASL